jgi:hypothetical protein
MRRYEPPRGDDKDKTDDFLEKTVGRAAALPLWTDGMRLIRRGDGLSYDFVLLLAVTRLRWSDFQACMNRLEIPGKFPNLDEVLLTDLLS